MPKISALEAMISIDDADQLPINDVSAATTKRLSLAGLVLWLQAKIGWIATAMLANSAVTTPKMKPTTIDSRASGGWTQQGTRFSTTSTSFVTVTGCSMNYTSGATAERLFVWMDVMAYATPGTGEAALFVNSTVQHPHLYIDPATPWARAGQLYIVDVAANTTVALSLRVFAAGGTTIHVTNEQSFWMPSLRGFAISNV